MVPIALIFCEKNQKYQNTKVFLNKNTLNNLTDFKKTKTSVI